MCLPIVHHLQPVLYGTKPVIRCPKIFRLSALYAPPSGKRVEGRARAAQTQGWIAPTMDELVCLRKKLDLANAPATMLQVKARSDFVWPLVIGADALSQSADLVNSAEVEG